MGCEDGPAAIGGFAPARPNLGDRRGTLEEKRENPGEGIERLRRGRKPRNRHGQPMRRHVAHGGRERQESQRQRRNQLHMCLSRTSLLLVSICSVTSDSFFYHDALLH